MIQTRLGFDALVKSPQFVFARSPASSAGQTARRGNLMISGTYKRRDCFVRLRRTRNDRIRDFLRFHQDLIHSILRFVWNLGFVIWDLIDSILEKEER